jgi:hypothetical protein
MKKTFLILITTVAGLVGYCQPVANNMNLGIFANGSNGSNGSSGAYLEFPLRIRPGGTSYTAVPAAEDFIVYMLLPKTNFAATDIVNVVQVNTAFYGATGTMSPQPVTDIGDPDFLYAGVVLFASGGMDLHTLNAVTNAWSFAFTIKITDVSLVDRTLADHKTVRILDSTNNAFISALFATDLRSTLQMSTINQLTNTILNVLPVNLLNFSGYKNGNKNTLRWTTADEQNNRGFEVQRSSDGISYSPIGFVNSQAPGGNSVSELSYVFDDLNAASRKQYYRLRQQDFDGRSKFSSVVVINGDKPTSLGVGGIFPNPASTQVNVIIDAPKRDDVTLLIMDAAGKTVKQKQVNVDIGSNTVPVDIANLASGSYIVKLVCRTSDCETAAGKFNKQ